MLASAAPSLRPQSTASPLLPRAPKYSAPAISGQYWATSCRLAA